MLRMIADRVEMGGTSFSLNARNELGQRISIGRVDIPEGLFVTAHEFVFTMNEAPDYRTSIQDLALATLHARGFYGLGPDEGFFEPAYWDPKVLIWRKERDALSEV
jgi:hypothetical protein